MTETGVPLEAEALASDADGSGRRRARRLPQPAVPAPLAVAGRDADRRQHGAVRADGHRLVETNPNTAVSLLILSFLVPAVLFSAVAGVYVDRVDRRLVLIATNVLRGFAIIGLVLVGDHFLLILLLNIFVSTVTVFFAPAEAAMIPEVVPRRQLLSANGVFTLTLNAAFALGFALLGPLVINIAGPQAVILVVAALYFLAAVFCFTLPPSPPPPRREPTAPHPRSARRARPSMHSTAGAVARRARLHPGEPLDRLVAALSRDHGVAGRRPRRAWAGLRRVGARPAAEGLRRHRAAARRRHRDGHPAAQRVRQVPATPARHRGRPDRRSAIALALLSIAGTDQPVPAARRRGERPARPVGGRPRCSRSSWSSRSSRASPTAPSPSRRRRSSRRTCRRRSAAASSAS